jgi:hypothetical protein
VKTALGISIIKDDKFLRATSRNELGIQDLSRHFICFSTLFREKIDSGMAAGSQA